MMPPNLVCRRTC